MPMMCVRVGSSTIDRVDAPKKPVKGAYAFVDDVALRDATGARRDASVRRARVRRGRDVRRTSHHVRRRSKCGVAGVSRGDARGIIGIIGIGIGRCGRGDAGDRWVVSRAGVRDAYACGRW